MKRLAVRSRRRVVPVLAVLALGCVGDRERPGGPTEPTGSARLSVRLLAPEPGATVLTGVDIAVRVEARELNGFYLQGVGFVARRLSAGAPVVDSAAIQFPFRSDSTHEFTLRVPNSLPTNTQVDIYGIGFGIGGATAVSDPVHVTVVQCTDPVCE